MTVQDSPPTSQEAQPPMPDVRMTGDGAASPPPMRQEALPPAHDAGTTGADAVAPCTVPKAFFPARTLVE
eukprot:6333252-Lingulodinium_polyedra.AAC.1